MASETAVPQKQPPIKLSQLINIKTTWLRPGQDQQSVFRTFLFLEIFIFSPIQHHKKEIECN